MLPINSERCWVTQKGRCSLIFIGYKFRDLGERMGLFIYFCMKLLYFSLTFNKTVPLRKASEAVKRKGRVCVPLPRGETQQLSYSGKTFLCRLNSKWIHLHLPSQPAPGAGWTTRNATQMSLPSRVHQLKLINIPPHAEDEPPAPRAAGPRRQSMMTAAAAGALGSRCTWLGAGKGTAKRWHRSSHIMQAELSCLQIESRGDLVAESWAHCIQGSWHLSESSLLVDWVPFPVEKKSNNTHTKQNKKPPPD